MDGVVSLLVLMREHLGEVRLQFCREDWAHGFRQLVLTHRDRRYLCALAWDSEMAQGEQIRVFIPRVVMFGPKPGPSQFCRASVGLLELANVYFAVCAVAPCG